MGEVQQKLKALEARQQELTSKEVRAEAALERAQKDCEEAAARLQSLGFESVPQAEEWLAKASEEITAQIEDVERVLTEAGV